MIDKRNKQSLRTMCSPFGVHIVRSFIVALLSIIVVGYSIGIPLVQNRSTCKHCSELQSIFLGSHSECCHAKVSVPIPSTNCCAHGGDQLLSATSSPYENLNVARSEERRVGKEC